MKRDFQRIRIFSIPLYDGSGKSDYHVQASNLCIPLHTTEITTAVALTQRMFGDFKEAV